MPVLTLKSVNNRNIRFHLRLNSCDSPPQREQHRRPVYPEPVRGELDYAGDTAEHAPILRLTDNAMALPQRVKLRCSPLRTEFACMTAASSSRV